jgi:cobalt-zinc-cadmium efflux system outer membrane protein
VLRRLLLAALAAAPLATATATGAEPDDDPVLAGLVRDALQNSAELRRAEAEVAAERERIPQAGALPDPTLSLGIQNDGFSSIEIGKAETSFWQVMLTQPLPWPGKRGLREEAARAQASAVEARLARVRLSTAAEVERGYVDLLLARGQLDLLGWLEALWKEAEAIARARYEVGSVPQSDLVRTQLERTRLAQQRIALEAAEATRVEALNRLRVHPLDEAIATTRKLMELPDPALPPLAQATDDAEARSPELAEARLTVRAAERRVALAERERFPDLSVSAAVMPRGSLDPMWLASVGVSLPIFSGRKQARAVAESASRRDGEERGADALRQVLALRVRERHTMLAAILRTVKLYRETLLVQSDAAVRSTLTQYKVGKVPFASVLEVMRGVVGDEGGFLEAVAQAQRVAIAAREVSLDAPAGPGGGAAASGAIPGSSGMAGGARGGAGGGAAQAAPSSGGASASPGM